ncbi:hypothetical protein [Streptomyces sp. NBC_01589]|uniref:hypothetical protein n=1 Tax=unclassified Streptomyces TaxID=2593676 RepID=UPI00386CE0B6
MSLLVGDRLRFACYAASRTVTGVCRSPLEAVDRTTLTPLPGGQRLQQTPASAGDGQGVGVPLCEEGAAMRERILADGPAIGEAIGLATEEIAAACDLLRRLAVATRGHGSPPVPSCGRAASVSRRSGGRPGAGAAERGSGGETCAGRFALLAHVLVGVVAERSVWTHGGPHRDVIPFSGTGLEGGMYVAGPRNIHLR